MKKIISSIIVLIVFLLASYKSFTIENKDYSLDYVIEKVNKEYRDKYGFPSNFYNGNYPVSKSIFEKYNILVCSINGVTEHGTKDKNGEYRYLGYDPYGEDVENPNYYYDALDGRPFDSFDWMKTPWLNKKIIEKFNINRSHFDYFASQFRDIFLYGFNYYHGENGVFGNHLGPNWRDLPWEEYYHIPIAPTETTRGVAWLFHKEKDGSIWYTSAWLPPLNVLELEETELVDIDSGAGHAVIGHNQINHSTYDVIQSVPSSEPLYIDISTEEYLLTLNVNKISGVHTYTEQVLTGYDQNGDPVYTIVTFYKPYHYYKIDHLEVYGLDHTITQNYALPDGSVTIYPDDQYYKIPNLDFNLSGGMSAIDSHVKVWNDRLIINNQVILDSTRVDQYAPAPNPVRIPMTQSKALYKEGLIIPPSIPNKLSAGSNTIAYYTYIGGTGGIGVKTRMISTNSVTVHTPVICDGGILSDNAFDQSIEVDASRASVILGRSTKIQLLTKGQHKNVVGYGNKDYRKYTDKKQVKIPFDVYMDTNSPDKDKYLKANTWYSVPNDQEMINVFVPTWVNEGDYTIEYRTIALNGGENASTEKFANISLEHYVATDTSPVKVIGRLYGFKIADIEDYPLWENVFRTGEKTYNHSDIYYTVGLKNKDGYVQGTNETYTLPLLSGSHPTVNNEGAIPLGYTFKFECETVGNYFSEKDCIEILPTFYYLSRDGQIKQEVDVWYSEYFNDQNNYFVKVGSSEDDQNVKYIKIGDPDRNVPSGDIKNTSRIVGLSEKAFKEKTAKLGWYDRIILAEPLRTFIGNSIELPNDVISDDALKSIQHWYGEYYLPNDLYAAPKGKDVLSYAKKHNGLNGKEDFWLRDGYLLVNFNIQTIQDGDFNHPILSYYEAPRCNMWQVEGFKYFNKDYYQKEFNLQDGDIVFYDLERKASDDYKIKGTH